MVDSILSNDFLKPINEKIEEQYCKPLKGYLGIFKTFSNTDKYDYLLALVEQIRSYKKINFTSSLDKTIFYFDQLYRLYTCLQDIKKEFQSITTVNAWSLVPPEIDGLISKLEDLVSFRNIPLMKDGTVLRKALALKIVHDVSLMREALVHLLISNKKKILKAIKEAFPIFAESKNKKYWLNLEKNLDEVLYDLSPENIEELFIALITKEMSIPKEDLKKGIAKFLSQFFTLKQIKENQSLLEQSDILGSLEKFIDFCGKNSILYALIQNYLSTDATLGDGEKLAVNNLLTASSEDVKVLARARKQTVKLCGDKHHELNYLVSLHVLAKRIRASMRQNDNQYLTRFAMFLSDRLMMEVFPYAAASLNNSNQRVELVCGVDITKDGRVEIYLPNAVIEGMRDGAMFCTPKHGAALVFSYSPQVDGAVLSLKYSKPLLKGQPSLEAMKQWWWTEPSLMEEFFRRDGKLLFDLWRKEKATLNDASFIASPPTCGSVEFSGLPSPSVPITPGKRLPRTPGTTHKHQPFSAASEVPTEYSLPRYSEDSAESNRYSAASSLSLSSLSLSTPSSSSSIRKPLFSVPMKQVEEGSSFVEEEQINESGEVSHQGCRI